MAKKAETIPEIEEREAMEEEQQEPIDVTEMMYTVRLPRALPGEEDCVFVSNGRENVTVKKGIPVEVPYWVYIRIMQSEDAQAEAVAYERWSNEQAVRGDR